MKKYHQLLIVSLGVLSFISFLIYKHEYDRLRNVLEVLEVFGSPPPPAIPSAVNKIQDHEQQQEKLDIDPVVDPVDKELKNSGEVFDNNEDKETLGGRRRGLLDSKIS